MPTWIDINLPWINLNSPSRGEVYRLSEEYTVWFEAETSRRWPTLEKRDWEIEHLVRVTEQYPEINETDYTDEESFKTLITRYSDPDFLAIAHRRRRQALCRNFEATSPECQDWLLRISAAHKIATDLQFHGHTLCRSGVVLEIRSSTGEVRRVLIGDCDDTGNDLATPRMAMDDIILRCMDLRPLYETGA